NTPSLNASIRLVVIDRHHHRPLRRQRDEATKLSRRPGALDVLYLGDAHLRAGNTEVRERFDQLSREASRVERRRCPYRDVGARGRLAHLVLEGLPSPTERRAEQVQVDLDVAVV